MEARDLEGLAQSADIPFCFNDGDPDHFVAMVQKDRPGLEMLLREFLDGVKDKKISLKVGATATHSDFLKSTGELLARDGKLKKDREALDEALKQEGYVIFAQAEEQDQKFPVGFRVAGRKGGAKVVGILIGLTDPGKK